MTNPGLPALSLRRFLILATLVLWVPWVWGDEPWLSSRFEAPASAYQAVANAQPSPPGADIEVLYDETSVVIDGQKRWTSRYYMVFRVLTAKGASNWDSLGAGWAPWYQEAPLLRARVFDADGSEHVLAPETIKESSPDDSSDKIYSDRRRLEAPLPAIGVGSIVEEETTVQDTQPSFEAGTVASFTFGNNAPTRHTRLIAQAPSGQAMRSSLSLLPDAKVTKTQTAGQTTIVVDQGNLPALPDHERYLPSDVPRRSFVALSTAADWRSVASAYAKVVDQQLGSQGSSPLVPSLVAAGTRADKIDAVVRWVARQIRYTGIEFGNSALVPHTPQETLARKYGDCKDKALLLVALLRDAAIPAELALLSAGPGLDVDSSLPGMGAFDHAIVHVPGSPELWLDPTDEFSRVGQLPEGDQGRRALLARVDTSDLTTIPRAAGADNLLLETREVTMASFGPGTVRETSQSFGTLEPVYRSFFAYRSDAERKDWAVSYADNEYRTKSVDSIEVSDPNDLTVPFRWTTVVHATPRSTTELPVARLWVRYEHLFERLPEWLRVAPDADHAATRIGSLLLPQSFVTELRIKVVPPEAFEATQIPTTTTVNLGPARLEETFTKADDGSVQAVLRFDTVTDTYTAAQAMELRTRILELVDHDPLEFRFEPETLVLAAQGRYRQALERGRTLAAAHPGSEHQLRYAQALSGLGLSEAARTEARRATEKAPQSSLAWQVLGEILEADVVGRNLRPGSDWAGAREALGRAKSLRADDQDLAGNLAVLDEYDSEGVRYGAGAPLDAAISVYRAQGVQGRKDAGLEPNLAYALFYKGLFAEAAAEAATLASPPLAVVVGSEAMIRGTDAAIALATRRVANAASRADALRVAGSMLMNLRKYPEAVALLKAGAVGSNATQTNALAATLAKTKASDDWQTDHSGPASAVQRLFGLFIRDLKLTDESRALFSRSARAHLGAASDNSLTVSLGTMVNTLRRSGILREAALDIILQVIQYRVDGTDQTGYRVRATVPGTNSISFLIFKEDGDFRIADLIATPGWSAADLRARVDAGQSESVRVVLDWIREEVRQGSGDDPASVPPFARFWKRGGPADASTLVRAIALATSRNLETAGESTKQLAAIAATLPEGQERATFEDALLEGYLLQDRLTEAAPLAVAALKRYPGSRTAFAAAVQSLAGSGQLDQAVAVTEEWLTSSPQDLQGLRLKAHSYEVSGRHEQAATVWQSVLDTGQSVPDDWNSAAWNLLYFPGKEKEGLELALHALQSNQDNGAILHTVACLFAVNGQPMEAKEALIKSMDAGGADTLNDDYRLAQGLLAETVGLTGIAHDLFVHVEPPEHASVREQSSYRIAQNHLKALPPTP